MLIVGCGSAFFEEISKEHANLSELPHTLNIYGGNIDVTFALRSKGPLCAFHLVIVLNWTSPSLLHTFVVDTPLNFPLPFNIQVILSYTNTSRVNALGVFLSTLTFPRSIEVGTCFQQTFGWSFFRFILVPKFEQLRLQLAVLASLYSSQFLLGNETDLEAVSVASLCRNFISKYIGSCPRPEARRLRPLCQPSTSLLVRMTFLNAVQSEGPHVPFDPGILFTYSVNCCRGSEACRWSRWDMGSISSSGRKGSAIIFLMNEYVPRSWLYSDWRPSSCTCSMDKRKRLGYWFHLYGVLISNKFIDSTLLIGCEHQMPTAADLYVSSQEPVWNVVFLYMEVKVCWILWS